MKKCPYCGKEYPDEATVCQLDANPLVSSKVDSLCGGGAAFVVGRCRSFMRPCPHCGKPVQFWSLWGLGKWRDYQCPKCHGYSQISVASRFASYAFGCLPVLVVFAILYNVSGTHSALERYISIAVGVFVAMSIQALFLGSAGNFRALPRKRDQ